MKSDTVETATTRATPEVRRQYALVATHLQGALAETVPTPFIVLNTDREVVFANTAAISLLAVDSFEELLGRRPGELVSCVHAVNSAGCGNSGACEFCGNVKAAIGARETGARSEESRVLTERQGRINALNLRVQAFRIEVGSDCFALMYLSDISREKYKEVLESLFLHDSLNALGGILGAVRIMGEQVDSAHAELAHAAAERTEQLIHELAFLQSVFSAEQDELTVMQEPVQASQLMQDMKLLGEMMECAHGKRIIVDDSGGDIVLVTDRPLLQRSLENLLKNALEASAQGDEVKLGFLRSGKYIHFYIRSRPFIPKHVQAQMFQRTFSTKGRGRGLGTYSARMFVTNYLGGSVSFESSPADGTVFYVQLPAG